MYRLYMLLARKVRGDDGKCKQNGWMKELFVVPVLISWLVN
ncbi:MAG: hypothetical protein WBA22_15765 [Candidatus Methanofastidiosia archaeon]